MKTKTRKLLIVLAIILFIVEVIVAVLFIPSLLSSSDDVAILQGVSTSSDDVSISSTEDDDMSSSELSDESNDVKIIKAWIETDVVENGRRGMKLHVNFRAHVTKSSTVSVEAMHPEFKKNDDWVELYDDKGKHICLYAAYTTVRPDENEFADEWSGFITYDDVPFLSGENKYHVEVWAIITSNETNGIVAADHKDLYFTVDGKDSGKRSSNTNDEHGSVVCRECGGSGRCFLCGGERYMNGSQCGNCYYYGGRCPTCNGTGLLFY